jgi:hypothetical protein
MTAARRILHKQPHSAIAQKAFLDHRNYCEAHLMSEEDVTSRILKTMCGRGVSETDAREAIQRRFCAARKK